MKRYLLCILGIALLTIFQISAQTFTSKGDGYWSNPNLWSTGKMPVKGDNVIISASDTVVVDINGNNGGAQCDSLMIEGALTFAPNNGYDPGTISVYKNLTIDKTGRIIPARDTSFLTSEIYQIVTYGDFINYGYFQTDLVNSKNSMKIMLSMFGSNNNLISADTASTYIYWINTYHNTILTGNFSCNTFELYGHLNNGGGRLNILNNGFIYLDTSASFSAAPVFGKDISITYNNNKTRTTGIELPDTAYDLSIADSLILNKSVTVKHKLTFGGKLFTGNNTLTLGDSAILLIDNDYHNYVIGNLTREFRSRDSLVFLVGTPGLAQARPIAIKLNNLSASGTKITVTASDSLVKMNSLPPDISAFEKYYFWNIKPSAGYAGNVDADVSLSFNDEYHNIQQLDYIHNSLAVTVLQGNQTTEQWNVVNNSNGTSALAIPANPISTVNARVKSFGDFTVGQLYKLPNGNFETWQYGWPYGWTVRTKAYASGISQTDTAHSGSYAVEGTVVTGYNNTIVAPDMRFSLPFLKKPQSIIGYYRFNPVGGDKFFVDVKLYKDTNVVGEGSFIDSSGTGTYQEFNIEIARVNSTQNDTTGLFPIDSLSIETGIKPGNSNMYHVGSQFLLDDLSFGKVTRVASSRNKIPDNFTLYQNYPNPFNPTTTIKVDNPKNETVKIVIYNILGQKVATLFKGNLNAGRYSFRWNADNFSSGIYFCRITAGPYTAIKKMVLEK